MNLPAPPEPQLQAEVGQLRSQFANTQELYREVCVLLFFRYGVTPTANRLYQLVRKGSMSAPAEALARFWATLREKSRVRIEHPDLPAELQAVTGELAAAIWMRATAMAEDSLAMVRQEAQLAAADAQARQADAEAAQARLQQALAASAAALDAARAQLAEREQALAVAHAATVAVQAQLQLALQEAQKLQQALEAARSDFSTGLERLRADGQLAQDRLRAAEARALLETDRERGIAARVQKEFDTLARKAEQDGVRQRAETQTLQAQLGDLRHQVGLLEGNLDAAHRLSAAHVAERDALRLQLAGTRAAGAQRPGQRPARARNASGASRTAARPGRIKPGRTGNGTN